jgi:hypothetical protein
VKLIINVPDDDFDLALEVATAERRDYAIRYGKPGWGWTIYRDGRCFWVCGIKGGISIRPSLHDVGRRAHPKGGGE